MNDDTVVHDSCGNVFADMEMRDADTRLAKAEIARVIRKSLDERGLNLATAAELLQITQPDLADLVRGKLARFEMERLERFLDALDMEARIQTGPRPE